MKFSELRKMIDSAGSDGVHEYQRRYFSKPVHRPLTQSQETSLDRLTVAITGNKWDERLEAIVGTKAYQCANEHAEKCLQLCPSRHQVWGKKIKLWSYHALQCYCILLLYMSVKGRKKGLFGAREVDIDEAIDEAIHAGGVWDEPAQVMNWAHSTYLGLSHIRFEEIDGSQKPLRRSKTFYNNEKELMLAWLQYTVKGMQRNVGQ